MDINNLDDHGSMENHPIHHQISSYDHHQYSSFWPNLPLHHQLHQIPSSSSHHHDDDVPPHDQLIGHVHHHPHHHQQGLLAAGNNHNFFMELDPHEDRDHEEQEAAAATSAAEEELGAMKEMMYKIAAMQPVDIDPATIRKPKRRNVRISDDPQSVAARHRRERISEKIRILQRLVPGGTKMDTASMLDEAIRYVKFLKRQIRLLQYSSTPSNTININNIDHGPHHQHDPHHPAPPPPPAHDDHHDPCNATTGAGLPLDWPPPNINNINDTNDHTQER